MPALFLRLRQPPFDDFRRVSTTANKSLARFDLAGIPPKPRGMSILSRADFL